jgi:surfeit locus 1 family protein
VAVSITGRAALSRGGLRARVFVAVATLAAVTLFVTAGNWQRARMEQKNALRTQYDAATRAEPLSLTALSAAADPRALRYRRAFAIGEFDASGQIFIDNRVYRGRAGYHVVTPLRLDDGRIALVNRGWVAPGPTRATLPDAPPPVGIVRVEGRLNVAGPGDPRPKGALWQHVDPVAYATVTGLAVLPVVIEQAPPVEGDALVRDWPVPDFGVEKHRIYMVQWYTFAALALALWIYFTWRAVRASPGTR